jgi:hypothetical protein
MVDHQALVAILYNYALNAIENLRIQRLKERLSPYSFKGKEHASQTLYHGPRSTIQRQTMSESAPISIIL